MNRRHIDHIAAALLLLGCTAALPAGAADAVKPGQVKPGQWQFQTQLQTAKMAKLPPGLSLPPGTTLPTGGMKVSHTQCIDPDKAVPTDPRRACNIDRMQRSGSVITWATTCHTGQGTVQSAGRARYSGNTMEASLKTRTPNGHGGFINSTQRITGHYLGPCTK